VLTIRKFIRDIEMSKKCGLILSNRQLKVGETIKRSLIEIVRDDLHELFLEKTSIIISEVRMTPDLKLAKVFLLPMIGSDLSSEALLISMNKIAFKVRNLLANRIRLRYLPEIKFILDDSFDRASKIESLLKDENTSIEEKQLC